MRKPLSVGANSGRRSTIVRLFALLILCSAFSISAYAQTLIVALGSSSVAGKGVWPWQAWPAQLEGMLKAKGYNVRVKNAGISGDTTSGILHRLVFAVPSRTKIVIFDTLGPYYNYLETTTGASQARGQADMEEIQARLKSRGIIIIPWSTRPPLSLRQADKKHPTADGHKLIAKQLMPRVIEALDSLGR
jgi:acyl-CoA thioesterase I